MKIDVGEINNELLTKIDLTDSEKEFVMRVRELKEDTAQRCKLAVDSLITEYAKEEAKAIVNLYVKYIKPLDWFAEG